MVLKFENFINETNNKLDLNDNNLWNEIEILRNKYPDFILNIKKNEKFNGDAYNVTIYHNDEYLVGIKGPCSLIQAYQTYKSTIEKHNINESLRDKMKPKSDEEILKELGNLSPEELLLTSAKYNYLNGVKIALENGADINFKSININTALMYAAYKGNNEIVEFLIKNGADINIKNINNNTALKLASVNGYKDIVELLIKNDADVNSKDKFGETALMNASYKGHKEIVELLLKNGADVNIENNDRYTALMDASFKGNKEIVELLKKYGAKE